MYANNLPYKEVENGNERNLLVEDLIKDIYAKNRLGLPTTRSSIKDNVLKRITKENAAEVFETYKQQTGQSLIKEIQNEWGLNSALKSQLINHLKSLISPKEIAHMLADDIYGAGSGKLDEDIKLLNKDNIQEVIKEYKEISIAKDIDMYGNLSNIPFAEYAIENAMSIEGIGDGLIMAIKKEFGLSNKKQEEYINYIKNTVLEAIESNPNNCASDIKTDILKHSNDYEKLDIDIMRFGHRNPTEPNENNTSPNGQIDSAFNQNHIGDCWLISGLMSIASKKNGKELLNKMISRDDKTGDIIVELKGVNKRYRVPESLIKKSNHLANGDIDIRAIEIAVDSYLKEQAYNGNADFNAKEGFNVDIDGNYTSTLFNVLFGNSESIDDIKQINQLDFNKQEIAYTLGINPENKQHVGQLYKIEGENFIMTEHMYAVLKETNDILYLYDPNITYDSENIDESKIIKISKNELYKLNPFINICKIS